MQDYKILDFFEQCLKIYPNKNNHNNISYIHKKTIFELKNQFIKAMLRYIDEIKLKNIKDNNIMDFKSFCELGYIEFLDVNYKKKDNIIKDYEKFFLEDIKKAHEIFETEFNIFKELNRIRNNNELIKIWKDKFKKHSEEQI